MLCILKGKMCAFSDLGFLWSVKEVQEHKGIDLLYSSYFICNFSKKSEVHFLFNSFTNKIRMWMFKHPPTISPHNECPNKKILHQTNKTKHFNKCRLNKKYA